MTKREAAVVSAYTGVLLGDFSDMHEYIEEVMERPVFTHELGNTVVVAELKEKSKKDFVSLEIN